MKCGTVNFRANQIKKRNKASRTPGKTKGERCQKDPTRAFFFANPRARNHPSYQQYHQMSKEWNKA